MNIYCVVRELRRGSVGDRFFIRFKCQRDAGRRLCGWLPPPEILHDSWSLAPEIPSECTASNWCSPTPDARVRCTVLPFPLSCSALPGTCPGITIRSGEFSEVRSPRSEKRESPHVRYSMCKIKLYKHIRHNTQQKPRSHHDDESMFVRAAARGEGTRCALVP